MRDKKRDGIFVLVHVDVVAFLDNHRIPSKERYQAYWREGSLDNIVRSSEAEVGDV